MACFFISSEAVFFLHFNIGLCFTVQNIVIVFHSGPAFKQCTELSLIDVPGGRHSWGSFIGLGYIFALRLLDDTTLLFCFKALGWYLTTVRYLWLKRWSICLTQWSLSQFNDHSIITYAVSNTDELPSFWRNSSYSLVEPAQSRCRHQVWKIAMIDEGWHCARYGSVNVSRTLHSSSTQNTRIDR